MNTNVMIGQRWVVKLMVSDTRSNAPVFVPVVMRGLTSLLSPNGTSWTVCRPLDLPGEFLWHETV